MTATRSGILIVDDEGDTLSLLNSILAGEGYEVRSADSGRLALGSLTSWLPELILLDIRMPDMDGFEALCRLKALETSRDVPIIFISGANELEERVKGLTLGAVDYICKPFQREELLARVRTHLELGRLRNQLNREVLERTAELNKTVERLLESEERFRNMADAAPVMIWMSSRDKLHTFLNRTWLTFTGRSIEDERDDGWTRGIHPDDLERYFEIHKSSFDARREFEMEYRLRRADGEFRWLLDKSAPRFAPNGEFVGYIGSAIDITDLKRIHEDAVSKEKLQSLMSLTRGIAHDFNNMMGAILAQAELAENDLPEGSAPKEEVRQIKAVTIQASEVVRELMIYSGQEQAKLAPVDLSELVEEISHLLKVSISKHAELHLDLPKDIPPVWGNAVQIRQLAMNLILNASEALGGNPGVIHVETSLPASTGDPAATNIADRRHHYVRLVVSDTGCGMTEQERARVFDPFFTTKPTGHGLGLAVVQGIVRSHNGVINVKSKPANGTTFEVLFRRAVAPRGAASPEAFSSTANESEPFFMRPNDVGATS
jgi:PAS domain S-box-containing protein